MKLQLHPFPLFTGISLLLTLATCVLFVWVDHFEDVGGELLKNASFEDGLVAWEHSANVSVTRIGSIDLSNIGEGESHYIHQSFLVPKSGFIRLTADIEVMNVRKGPEVWQTARIGLLGRETEGEWRWDFPGTLLQVVGTQILQNRSRVIEIPHAFSELRVECELSGGSGAYFVQRVSAQEVAPKSVITGVVWVLKVFWLLFVIMLFVYFCWLRLYLEVLVVSLVGGLLLFIQESTKLSLLSHVNDFIPVASYLPIDHFLLFLFISVMIIKRNFGHGALRLGQTIFALVVFSLATEVLQFFTSHRDPLVIDAVANILGIVAAVVVAMAGIQLGSKIMR